MLVLNELVCKMVTLFEKLGVFHLELLSTVLELLDLLLREFCQVCVSGLA